MEARQVRAALSAMRNKTDRHEDRGIAQILRASRVHVKSQKNTRALLSYPAQRSERSRRVPGVRQSDERYCRPSIYAEAASIK